MKELKTTQDIFQIPKSPKKFVFLLIPFLEKYLNKYYSTSSPRPSSLQKEKCGIFAFKLT